jgi:hypothetical protein
MTICVKSRDSAKMPFIRPFPPGICRPEKENEQVKVHRDMEIWGHVTVHLGPKFACFRKQYLSTFRLPRSNRARGKNTNTGTEEKDCFVVILVVSTCGCVVNGLEGVGIDCVTLGRFLFPLFVHQFLLFFLGFVGFSTLFWVGSITVWQCIAFTPSFKQCNWVYQHAILPFICLYLTSGMTKLWEL